MNNADLEKFMKALNLAWDTAPFEREDILEHLASQIPGIVAALYGQGENAAKASASNPIIRETALRLAIQSTENDPIDGGDFLGRAKDFERFLAGDG